MAPVAHREALIASVMLIADKALVTGRVVLAIGKALVTGKVQATDKALADVIPTSHPHAQAPAPAIAVVPMATAVGKAAAAMHLAAMAVAAIRVLTARAAHQAATPCLHPAAAHRPSRAVVAVAAALRLVEVVAAAVVAVVAVVAAVAAVVVVAVDKENKMTHINLKTTKRIPVLIQLSRFMSVLRSLALAMLLSIPLAGVAADQKTFATPDEALGALTAALQADDDNAVIAIFGEQYKHLVTSPDKAATSANRAKALAALQAFHALEEPAPDRRVLLIGVEAWPFPIPLVQEKGAWRFATELGDDEIINRRIGANEREAIAVLRAYLDAQQQYAAKDRNGDDVREYAQKIASTPGKQDGLYWPADESKGEETSPFGPLIASAADYLKGHTAGDAYRGYYFRILTRQGNSAPGGAFSYLINGRMLAGFAMVAYPAEYGVTGVMTFIISNNGKIYEKNLGKNGALIKEYNPTKSWKRVE